MLHQISTVGNGRATYAKGVTVGHPGVAHGVVVVLNGEILLRSPEKRTLVAGSILMFDGEDDLSYVATVDGTEIFFVDRLPETEPPH